MPHPNQLLDIKVPTRDGINLAANIYFPEGESPSPVLLNRILYIQKPQNQRSMYSSTWLDSFDLIVSSA